MKIWTVNCSGYEMGKDIRDGCHEFTVPYSVHSDRDGAVAAVVSCMNQEIVEYNDQLREDGDDDPDFLDSINPLSLKWHDCHTFENRKLRWKTYHELEECWYIIGEHELDGE